MTCVTSLLWMHKRAAQCAKKTTGNRLNVRVVCWRVREFFRDVETHALRFYV